MTVSPRHRLGPDWHASGPNRPCGRRVPTSNDLRMFAPMRPNPVGTNLTAQGLRGGAPTIQATSPFCGKRCVDDGFTPSRPDALRRVLTSNGLRMFAPMRPNPVHLYDFL